MRGIIILGILSIIMIVATVYLVRQDDDYAGIAVGMSAIAIALFFVNILQYMANI